MTRIQEVLAHNIKELRRLSQLTQAQLAEKASISGNYVALIERGMKFPSAEMIERIAVALEVDSTELFRPREQRFTNPWNWASHAAT